MKIYRYAFTEATFGQTEAGSHYAFSSSVDEIPVPWCTKSGLLAALAAWAPARFGGRGVIVPATALVEEVREFPTCPTIDERQSAATLKVPYGAFSQRVAEWESAIPAAFRAIGDKRGETPMAAVFGRSAGNGRVFVETALIFGQVDRTVKQVAEQLQQLTVNCRRFDAENLAYQKHLMN